MTGAQEKTHQVEGGGSSNLFQPIAARPGEDLRVMVSRSDQSQKAVGGTRAVGGVSGGTSLQLHTIQVDE